MAAVNIYITNILQGLGLPDPSIELVVDYYGTVDTIFPLTELQEAEEHHRRQREHYEIVD